jgi:acyl carrier protein
VLKTTEEIECAIKRIVSDVLGVNSEIINDLSSPRSIEGWKGMKHREIIERLESEFGLEFDQSEIETLVNYRIIKSTILAHLA